MQISAVQLIFNSYFDTFNSWDNEYVSRELLELIVKIIYAWWLGVEETRKRHFSARHHVTPLTSC